MLPASLPGDIGLIITFSGSAETSESEQPRATGQRGPIDTERGRLDEPSSKPAHVGPDRGGEITAVLAKL
jgi:hypothetical protein